MNSTRGEVHQRLMRTIGVVVVNISADLLPCRLLVWIVSHQVDLLLLDGSVESLGDGVVRGASDSCKGEFRPDDFKKLFGDPCGVWRSLVHSKLGFSLRLKQNPLGQQSLAVDSLHMRGVDRRNNIKSNDQTREKIITVRRYQRRWPIFSLVQSHPHIRFFCHTSYRGVSQGEGLLLYGSTKPLPFKY